MSATARPAEDTAASLYVALGRLVRTLRRSGEGVPVGPGAMSAMMTLHRSPDGLRLGALAECEGVSAPSLTRIVDSLERLGLAHRTPDPDDGRAHRVSLTAAGRDLIASGAESRVGVLRGLLDELDPAQRSAIEAALPAFEALGATVAVPA